MRISDWSSDVCSSDLCWSSLRQPRRAGKWTNSAHRPGQPGDAKDRKAPGPKRSNWRTEEHTSELQSLMRTSYAVFCLNKQTKQKQLTLTREISTPYCQTPRTKQKLRPSNTRQK